MDVASVGETDGRRVEGKGNGTTIHTRPNHDHATWTLSHATCEDKMTKRSMRNVSSAIGKDAKRKKNERKGRHASSEGVSKEGRRDKRAMVRLRTTRDADERMD